MSIPAVNVFGPSDWYRTIRDQIQQAEDQVSKVENLGIPLGWNPNPFSQAFPAWLQTILGWLMTAIAVSLGAPFWFDMLNKIVNVRLAEKPAEESTRKA